MIWNNYGGMRHTPQSELDKANSMTNLALRGSLNPGSGVTSSDRHFMLAASACLHHELTRRAREVYLAQYGDQPIAG